MDNKTRHISWTKKIWCTSSHKTAWVHLQLLFFFFIQKECFYFINFFCILLVQTNIRCIVGSGSYQKSVWMFCSDGRTVFRDWLQCRWLIIVSRHLLYHTYISVWNQLVFCDIHKFITLNNLPAMLNTWVWLVRTQEQQWSHQQKWCKECSSTLLVHHQGEHDSEVKPSMVFCLILSFFRLFWGFCVFIWLENLIVKQETMEEKGSMQRASALPTGLNWRHFSADFILFEAVMKSTRLLLIDLITVSLGTEPPTQQWSVLHSNREIEDGCKMLFTKKNQVLYLTQLDKICQRYSGFGL